MLRTLLLSLIAVITLHGTAVAQRDANRTTSTRIADLLAQMPAENSEELQAHAEEIAGLGEAGIVQMAGMLSPPGEGENAKLEYAIGGFSYFVSQGDREDWRKLAQRAYCLSLEKASNHVVKAFLIGQLQMVGDDEAIVALQPYLTNEQLADPAARALAHIGTPQAGNALLLALDRASASSQLSIIQALGDMRYAEAEAKLRYMAESGNDDLRKVTLYALASIAHPASAKILEQAASRVDYQYEASDATASYLEFIDHLVESGHKKEAGRRAKRLLKKARGPEQVHTQIAALSLLVRAGNADKQLFKAMKHANPAYRRAALKLAGGLLQESAGANAAATAAWVKQLERAKDAGVRAEIITMLGNNQATTALPAVNRYLASDHLTVRLAAIKASQQLGQTNSLGDLLQVMKNGGDQEIAAIQQALLVMDGDGLPAQVAGALPEMPDPAKAALIDVLGARAADAHLDVVLAEVKNPDSAVRASAFNALGTLVTSDDIPVLFKLLSQVDDKQEINQVQDALITALSGVPDQSDRADRVLSVMNHAPATEKPRYFRILASVGGPKALHAVSQAFDAGSAEQKQAALTALTSWADDGAADELYRISHTAPGENAAKALDGYVRLVSQSTVPPAQKLLQLRKAMENAKNAGQKKRILVEAQKTGTFLALVFAGKYLDEPDVAQTAAQVVMNIALDHKEYDGEAVRDLVTKTIETLQGQDSDYQKEALRKHLADMPDREGFVQLFNGKDLTGWKGLVANPIKRAEMDAATLAKEQAKADERMREGWYAEDGKLIFSGHGDNICTVEQYGDFEMYVDWQIEKDGDAGIYLRGTPQVQIWDTARVDVGAQVGSGGLYNNQTHPSKPLVLADNAIGDWNTFRILMKGERVTVYLNGQLVVDNVVMENFWDRSQPIFPVEQLELQAHGTRVAYRDIYVRRLDENGGKFTLSDEEKAQGFEVLFDGTSLDKWTGNTEGYVVENGDIVIYPEKGNGNLFTKNEYADFNFRFEFLLTPGANNGLGIRAPLEGDAAYQGMELQILDNTADIYKNLEEYQYHGSVYGVIPAKRGFLKPVGEWNQQEVIVKGNQVKVILNGEVILDGNIAEASKNGTIDGREHPGLKRKSGHIGFLGHGSIVRFRNIRILDLGK